VTSGGEDLVVGGLRIPAGELQVDAVRSGGPGGQNVNKVASQVLLRFPVTTSPSLSETQRALVIRHLGHRLTGDGDLLLRASRFRERRRNLEDARERLGKLLEAALRPRKARKPTRPTRGSRERRLRGKRQRGELKRGRGGRPGLE